MCLDQVSGLFISLLRLLLPIITQTFSKSVSGVLLVGWTSRTCSFIAASDLKYKTICGKSNHGKAMDDCFFMKCFPGFFYRLRKGETMTAGDVKDFCTGQVSFLLQ